LNISLGERVRVRGFMSRAKEGYSKVEEKRD
jgi:hypothetical protein